MFCLRLGHFENDIVHIPGKLLVTADTLLHSPLHSSDVNTSTLQEEAEYLLEACIDSLPASNQYMEEFCNAQVADPVCSIIINYC